MIKAIYEVPPSILPFVYQVIAISTNVNDPSTVYLLDEGLELWLVVIQYANSPNEALFKLCDNLLPIIGEWRCLFDFIRKLSLEFADRFIHPSHPRTVFLIP